MAVKISLNGVNISGNSKLLTNSTIQGNDVDIEMKQTTLKDGSSILDSTEIIQAPEPKNQQFDAKNNGTDSNSFVKGVASFVRDVAVNLISDGIKGKF